jgi:hypothetical protein
MDRKKHVEKTDHEDRSFFSEEEGNVSEHIDQRRMKQIPNVFKIIEELAGERLSMSFTLFMKRCDRIGMFMNCE